MSLAPGAHLGPYEIDSLLGTGGMGEVYKARDTRLDRIVAIKVLAAGDPEADARLLREARAAAALNHPHVCTLHEIATAGDRTFIVMEYVDGRVLSEMAAEGLPLPTALRYGVQMADALAHAHDRGVLHRDLKTANLMVTADRRIKVLDFGIAHRLHAAGEALTATLTGALGTATGTLAYMAPETLRGAPADRRTDLWSLGVVLYEMLAGRRPFDGQTAADVSSAILRDSPPPLPAPPAIRAVVARCLAKEPAERYQSAAEVRAALEALAGAAADLAQSPMRPARATRTSPATPGGRKITRAGRPRIRSLAVLPLENLSNDPEQDYFADGMTEALIAELARVESLRVISRSSAMRYKATGKSRAQIARELDVEGILEGSVRCVQDDLRVTLELIDARTDRHLWAQSYDRDLKNVLQLQREIAATVAGELQIALTPGVKARLAADRVVRPAAYDAYLRGRHHLRLLVEPALSLAASHFQRAIEIQPDLVQAHAGLAELYLWRTQTGTVESREAASHARTAARRAHELDPTLPEAHLSLALIAMYHEWDWRASADHFRRAIELNAGYADAHLWYGWYLACVEAQYTAALQEIEAAEALDPHHAPIKFTKGFVYSFAGDQPRALESFQAAIALEPRFWMAHYGAACVQAYQGHLREAIAGFELALTYSDRATANVGMLGWACGLAGQRERAQQLRDELKARGDRGYVTAYWIAEICLGLGDIDATFEWLERARLMRDGDLIYVTCARDYDGLRSDPRYRRLVAAMGLAREAPPAMAASPRIQSVAVLPLANLSDDPEQEYFADGMTEAVIANLARISALRVISRTSIMQYKNARKPLPQIARELNVDAIVEGSVLRAGQRVRITAQLIHAPSDTHLWAESYERDLRNVLALQSDVARAIAQEIRIQVTPQEQARLAAVREVDPDVYALYLQGRYYWNRMGDARFRRSIEYFEQAIARDPDYAPAHAGVADYYNVLAWFGWARPRDVVPKAKAAARRAIELDESLVEAHAALGYTAIYFDWDWVAAERELSRAIELNPGYAMAHQYYAWYLGMHGRMAESIAASERARALDPLSVLLNVAVGQHYVIARDYERAITQLQHTLDMDPNAAITRWSLAWAFLRQRRFDEAIRELQKVLDLTGGAEFLSWLGYAYALAGAEEKARSVLDALLSKARDSYVPPDDLARIYVALGETDCAFAWLDRAIDERSGWVPWLASDASVDPLRADPRFAAVLQRVGLGAV